MDHCDVGVIERGNGACFANEKGAIVMVSRGEKLDCDLSREVQVLREIDNAHTTFAQFLDNAVMGDGLADHGRCEKGTLWGDSYLAAIVRQGAREFKN